MRDLEVLVKEASLLTRMINADRVHEYLPTAYDTLRLIEVIDQIKNVIDMEDFNTLIQEVRVLVNTIRDDRIQGKDTPTDVIKRLRDVIELTQDTTQRVQSKAAWQKSILQEIIAKLP